MHQPDLLAPRIGVLVIFFTLGAIFSTWVARIPDVQQATGLSTGEFGFALLGVAAGSLLSMPAAGYLIARFGSKPVTMVSAVWLSLSLVPTAWAGSLPSLGAALCVLGLAAGALDVGMNAQGVLVERAARKPMMSGFHAMFSIGGMAGSALGGVIAKLGVDVHTHFLGAAIVCSALSALAGRALLPAGTDAAPGRRTFHLDAAVAGLGFLTFCFFLGEGAMADWTGIYLSRSLGAGPAQAAAGYACFSGAMAVGRLAGDSLRSRFGAVSLVRYGSLLASAGLTLGLVSSHAIVALAGFTVVGFGCSIIVPLAFAASGASGGAGALTTVVAAGYFGLFVGPPFIGMMAEAVTLRWALLVVVGCLGAGILLAPAAQAADPE